jgi:hypothetical protein
MQRPVCFFRSCVAMKIGFVAFPCDRGMICCNRIRVRLKDKYEVWPEPRVGSVRGNS